MRFLNKIIIFLLYFYTYPTFSSNNFDLMPIEVSKNVFVFIGDNNDASDDNGGAISNTGFIIGENAILVIDAGPSYLYASNVIDIINSYSNLPIKYLVVTHHHADHSFGISKYLEINTEIIMAEAEVERYIKYGNRSLRQLSNNIGEEWFFNTKITSFQYKEKEYPINLDLGTRNIIIELYEEGHSDGDLIVKDINSNTLFVGDLVFGQRAPTSPHANIYNWKNYLDEIIKKDWDILIPGHGDIIKNKEDVLQTKKWITFIDKTAKEASANGISALEIFNKGLPNFIKGYKLAKETWYRDLPVLINKYEFD
ncbi:MAG: hypothetical protein CMJ07_09165 [Pelagibacterales bacterium]|nr:hypothetical protein [Pelagibacterales bacterium]OUV25718.1 MAG: hypothetical protein CBC69_06870 [Alphaproteobacteria bacterium TMED109]|tara:strand:+ start:793 stop:1725 length:933 start_codon:yes stop_codon:yes gene_type:complete